MNSTRPSSIAEIESESIFILREVARQFERPVLLYSAGKDSTVLLHLSRKAFYPGRIPFPLLHVDTGFKFPEMYQFRDQTVKTHSLELIVYRNEEAIEQKANPQSLGTQKCCSLLKTQALLQALKKYKIDAAIGGARRDEERSRAKERVFSFRDKHGQWDPKNQRPELWSLYNGQLNAEESIRVFPLSNWTEKDIWTYIQLEKIPVVPLYFAKGGSRFRTLGCIPCSGTIESTASSVEEILAEVSCARTSERATRAIDHDRDGSMEIKKLEGYF